MPEKIDAIKQKEIFSRNLGYYMNQTGKNTADLAADLSFPFSTVSDWVHGKKYPRMDKVQAIADYFGIMKSNLTEEKSPSSADAVALEEEMNELLDLMNDVLIRLGFIREGQDLTHRQSEILVGICKILRAAFED